MIVDSQSNENVVSKETCDVIVDSRNNENVISKELVKAMGLSTKKHLSPYKMDEEGK